MAHQAYEYDPYYLNPYHPSAVPPAAPLPPPPPPYDYGGLSDWNISTLFVAGLPDDVKPREIHNLFRRRIGFDYCQLKYTGRGNQVVAFVTFLDHQAAVAALHALNGVKFDPQAGSVLHIELARSNSTRKRKPGAGAYVVIDRRNRKTDVQGTSSDDGESESDDVYGTDRHASSGKGDVAQAASEAGGNPENAANGPQAGDGASCSTLFIANLGPTCTQDELKQVFSQYPGFNVLKMRAKGGMPVAFADFEEVEQATRVMTELQGSLLASSDRGGMHLEYARSKMRQS